MAGYQSHPEPIPIILKTPWNFGIIYCKVIKIKSHFLWYYKYDEWFNIQCLIFHSPFVRCSFAIEKLFFLVKFREILEHLTHKYWFWCFPTNRTLTNSIYKLCSKNKKGFVNMNVPWELLQYIFEEYQIAFNRSQVDSYIFRQMRGVMN